MSSLSEVAEAIRATNKIVEDTGLFVADYIVDELRKTTDALKNVGGTEPAGITTDTPRGVSGVEPVGIDSAVFTKMSQDICDAIIFQTEYLDNTLQKVGQSITASVDGLSKINETANEDNSGREIKPLTTEGVEEATVQANKSFFGADFGKSFLGFAEKVSSGAGRVVGKAKDVALKPVVGAWDKLKEVFARMSEIFLAVGFMKFLQGWEKASAWFGDNANFGEKLAAGLANLLQSFLGLTDTETKKLAENMSLVFGKIFTWLEATFTGLFKGVSDLVVGLFSGDGSRVWEGIKQIFNTLVDSLGEIAKGILNLFVSPETSEAIIGTITKYLKMIPNAIEAVWSGIKSALASIIDFVNNNVIKYIPKVPYIKNPFTGGGSAEAAPAATPTTPTASTSTAATPTAATPTAATPTSVTPTLTTPGVAPTAATPQTTSTAATPTLATPTRTQSVSEASRVAEQSRSNAAAKETVIPTSASAPASNNIVTQVNNSSNNKTVYGLKFETKPGIGNSSWAVSHAMP